MLSKCANPACNTTFRYLREGKLFEFDASTLSAAAISGVIAAKRKGRVEYFWLCGKCMAEMTVTIDRDRGVVIVPLRSKAGGDAAA
ncbi:MAG TPA: hypothetical protein VK473_00455 [Terriglobales bacterium]|nr:hypothetical protein [Terriglobales bacterium]